MILKNLIFILFASVLVLENSFQPNDKGVVSPPQSLNDEFLSKIKNRELSPEGYDLAEFFLKYLVEIDPVDINDFDSIAYNIFN